MKATKQTVVVVELTIGEAIVIKRVLSHLGVIASNGQTGVSIGFSDLDVFKNLRDNIALELDK